MTRQVSHLPGFHLFASRRFMLVIVVFVLMPPVSASVEAQPINDWTGYYAGLNIGYGWGGHAIKMSGDPQTEATIDLGILPSALADDPSGVVGGAQAGYSQQIRWLVLGVEAALGATLLHVYDDRRAEPGVSGNAAWTDRHRAVERAAVLVERAAVLWN
jgi:opacity protein-like surface antigen